MDDLKNVGESNYNPGDGMDQRVQSLEFMMMIFTAVGFPTGDSGPYTYTQKGKKINIRKEKQYR